MPRRHEYAAPRDCQIWHVLRPATFFKRLAVCPEGRLVIRMNFVAKYVFFFTGGSYRPDHFLFLFVYIESELPEERDTHNESDWSELTGPGATPYLKSKTLAARDGQNRAAHHPFCLHPPGDRWPTVFSSINMLKYNILLAIIAGNSALYLGNAGLKTLAQQGK